MKEKLIAELQGLADMMPPICDRDRPATVLIFDKPVTVYCKPFEQFQDVLRRAAEALADDGVPAQKWIPVTERLPEGPLETVLVSNGKSVCVGVYSVVYDQFGVMCGRSRKAGKSFGVTHWMPLPEPPEGE